MTRAAFAAAGAAVILAGAMLLFAPSTATGQDAGCVYSGGGWICAGAQPPSEPGEPIELPAPEPAPAPDPEPVEPAPAPPTEPAPAPAAPSPAPPPVESSVCD